MTRMNFGEWTRRDPTVTHWCLSLLEVWRLYKDPDVQAVMDAEIEQSRSEDGR